MKKIFSMILSATLLISVFSAFDIPAYALTTSGTCGDNATWSYSGGTLTISGTGKMKDFTQYDPNQGIYVWNQPYEYNYPWKDIDRSITTVVIEEGITYIGNYAFADLTNLENVEFPSTLKKIGEKAFYRCDAITRVDVQSLEVWCDIEFPYLYSNPLYYAHKLYVDNELVEEELSLPAINKIKAYAFANMFDLKTIVFPDTVETIEGGAFYNCFKTTNVIFPKSLKVIGGEAFSHCRALKTINLPDGLIEIGYHAFDYCHGLTEVRIPNSVKAIEGGAFYECMNLKNVYLGMNISRIESDAFEKVEYGEPITDVYYYGDEDSLNRVKIYDWNDQLMEAEWHFLHDHVFTLTVIEKTDNPHKGVKIYDCECGLEYKEGYMYPNKFIFENYKNGYFYYYCEVCDEVESTSKDRLKTVWKEYSDDDWSREYWYNETCLDLNGDGVINAKDYAKIQHLSKYGY